MNADLDRPDMFRCEKYRCVLRKVVCVGRQEKARAGIDRIMGRTNFPAHQFMGCVNCRQGREIAGIREVFMEEKACIKCGMSKTLTEFSPNKTSRSGYENECKECRNRRMREKWRSEHPGCEIRVKEGKAKERVNPVPAPPVPPPLPLDKEDHVPLVEASEVKELVDAHWKYIGALLKAHGIVGVELIEYHYRTAFVHGYKHGVERVMEVMAP